MQNSINQHTNPMAARRPFIKKRRQSNLSFMEKPNLSMTNATHRLSLDRTLTSASYRKDSITKNPHHLLIEFTEPEISSNNKQSFSARLSLGKENSRTFNKRNLTKKQKETEHKQKLRSILQSIDVNNSIIQKLFEFQDQISFFKKQIAKTLNLHNNLHSQLKTQMKENSQDRKLSLNFCKISERIQKIEHEEFSNKIQQLRNKKKTLKKQKDCKKDISIISSLQLNSQFS